MVVLARSEGPDDEPSGDETLALTRRRHGKHHRHRSHGYYRGHHGYGRRGKFR